MKTKIFYLFIGMLIFCSSFLFCEPEPVEPSGSGTAEDPFLISSIENLYWLTQNSDHWDKHFEQTADIDAEDTENWDEGEGFTPIGDFIKPFTGTYDGTGHRIYDIMMYDTFYYWASGERAFFGCTDGAVIKNLRLINLNIDVPYMTGGIAADILNTTIKNCYTTGKAYSGHNPTGGIVGKATESTITNCYSTCSLSSESYAGGIVGIANNSTVNSCNFSGSCGSFPKAGGIAVYSKASTISNCYFSGEVGSGYGTGGIVVFAEDFSIIKNCYSTGFIFSIEDPGGIVLISDSSYVNNCYANTDFYGEELFTYGAIGKTTAEMTLYGNNGADPTAVYANWDFYDAETNPDGVWAVDETHGGYPYLKKLADLFGTNTLTVNADGNGSAYGSGKYNIGASAAVYAEPDEDYFFIKWYSDSDTALFDEQAYLHPLEGDEVLYAKFDDTNVSIDDNPIYTYSLSQNKPNPFNPSTVIKYSIPEDSFVKVEVYNILGRKIKTLVSGSKEKGEYSVVWNGTDSNGEKVSSGVYFYRIINRGEVINKKMLLMK